MPTVEQVRAIIEAIPMKKSFKERLGLLKIAERNSAFQLVVNNSDLAEGFQAPERLQLFEALNALLDPETIGEGWSAKFTKDYQNTQGKTVNIPTIWLNPPSDGSRPTNSRAPGQNATGGNAAVSVSTSSPMQDKATAMAAATAFMRLQMELGVSKEEICKSHHYEWATKLNFGTTEPSAKSGSASKTTTTTTTTKTSTEPVVPDNAEDVIPF